MARAFCLSLLLFTFSATACSGDDDDDSAGGSSGNAGTPVLQLGGSAGSGAQSGSSSGGTSTPADGGAPSAGSSSTSGGQPASAGTGTGGNTLYLPCEAAADCKKYGGGKVCCAMGTMHFCTKPSGCSGDLLP